MRILILCTDAYGGHGGIALYNRDLAAALALDPAVEEVTVLPRIVHGPPGPIPEKVTFFRAAAAGLPAYVAATMKAAVQRPDVIICGHVNLMPLAAAIGRPVLFTWGIDAWKPPGQPLFSAAMKRCRAVVAISECTRGRFLGWSGFAGPTHVLPNAIHLEDYGVRPRRLDLASRLGVEGRRCLLTVGRLETRERYKGFDEVMEVLGDLPSDVVYLLAGDGNDRSRLEAKAASLGVSDRVVFTGRFSDEDKADLYGLADAYVMPGRGEGFGFVILEALASGLPVVGSKLDGTREALLDGELGLLIDPTNPAEVRAALLEVLQPRERVIPPGIAHFSFERFAARTHELLASIGVRS